MEEYLPSQSIPFAHPSVHRSFLDLLKFNRRRVQDQMQCWRIIAEDFAEKISSNDPVLLYWIGLLDEFQGIIHLLEKFLSDAMTVNP